MSVVLAGVQACDGGLDAKQRQHAHPRNTIPRSILHTVMGHAGHSSSPDVRGM
jgi:hypothetical protein